MWKFSGMVCVVEEGGVKSDASECTGNHPGYIGLLIQKKITTLVLSSFFLLHTHTVTHTHSTIGDIEQECVIIFPGDLVSSCDKS